MFNKIKTRIKQAKAAGIVIAILFVFLLASNAYLLCKVNNIENSLITISK